MSVAPNVCWNVRIAGGSASSKCEHCGTVYRCAPSYFERSKKHFCSSECRFAAQFGENNPNWRGGKLSLACKQCGAEFFLVPGATKKNCGQFCSNECKYAYQTIYPSRVIAAREQRRKRDTRERMSTVGGHHTYEQWEDLKRRAKYRCVKCKKKRPLTRDHIIPVSKGGSDLIINIQPLCKSCNSRKYTAVENLL